jgi:hypothetical protein
MLRRLARLCRAAAAYLAPPSQFDAHRAGNAGRAVGNALCSVPSAGNSARRRSARRQFFTPLRVEWLERREVLTGTVSVSAMMSSITEGTGASLMIQGTNLPAGGVTVNYQTTPGTATAGTDYMAISGSVYLSPMMGTAIVSVNTHPDGVYDPNETFTFELTSVSGDATIGAGSVTITITETGMPPPPGPNPQYIILSAPATLQEGQNFTLTGLVSPAGVYHLVGTVNWGGFVTSFGNNIDLWTTSAGSFSISNVYHDDGASPGNGSISDAATISLNVSVNGTQLSAQTNTTVHNIAPTAFVELNPAVPLGGPGFVVSGSFTDPGLADVHTVTVNWGDGSLPDVFTHYQASQFTRSHAYPATGQNYTVNVELKDDDLGVLTWSFPAPMYLLDIDNDANNDGAFNAADEPIEDILPAAYVDVNSDDDNENDIVDMALNELTPVNNEDNLAEFRLQWTPANRPDANNYVGWWVALYATPSYAIDPTTGVIGPGAIAIYDTPNKQNLIPFVQTVNGLAAKWPATGTVPSSLYLEARAPGPITLSLRLLNPSEFSVDGDAVVFTAATPMKVQDVDFILNEHLVSDPATNGAVTDYTALSEWHDENTNGSVADMGDRRYPLAFERDITTNATVTIKGSLAGAGDNVKVRVRSSHNNIDTQTDVQVGDIGESSFTATVVLDFHDKVDYLESFDLQWEVSLDNGETWKSVGTTTHPVYLTFRRPGIDPIYHTVVHLGSAYGKNAENHESETSVVAAIWDNFKDRTVKRVAVSADWQISEGTQMVYWGPQSLGLAEENAASTTSFLLAYADGKCKAWTNLLEDVLAAQGIGANQKTIVPKPVSFAIGAMDGILIKNYTFSAADAEQIPNYGPVYLAGFGTHSAAGIAGQGNPDPPSRFVNHEIVIYNDKIYDPSYGGNPYNDLLNWEAASLAAVTFKMMFQGATTPVVAQHLVERQDTQFE